MGIIYILKGDPAPLARPRFSGRHVWDSQQQQKIVAGLDIRYQHGLLPKFKGPVHLDMLFFMQIPKAKSRRKQDMLEGKFHYYRPDLDNLIKYIADVSTGVLFDDDCIISLITCKKLYDKNPRTEFSVMELEKNG
jgi:Holliday junction resolvase RusA-like endonuclease